MVTFTPPGNRVSKLNLKLLQTAETFIRVTYLSAKVKFFILISPRDGKPVGGAVFGEKGENIFHAGKLGHRETELPNNI
jgi:hypothetical protein